MPTHVNEHRPILLLAPTRRELDALVTRQQNSRGVCAEICGFGTIVAAARTAQMLANYKPRRVLLAGIAGTYDEKILAIGTASCFRSVAVDGIGAGTGERFITAAEMGFPQWPGHDGDSANQVGDRLRLDALEFTATADLLLTCCAASACVAEAALRRRRFPAAVAEDLEAFGVAAACALANVPLTVVRGASNVAGNRDHATWRIDDALSAASELVQNILRSWETKEDSP